MTPYSQALKRQPMAAWGCRWLNLWVLQGRHQVHQSGKNLSPRERARTQQRKTFSSQVSMNRARQNQAQRVGPGLSPSRIRRSAVKLRQPWGRLKKLQSALNQRSRGLAWLRSRSNTKRVVCIAVYGLRTRLLPEAEVGCKGAGWSTATGSGTAGGTAM